MIGPASSAAIPSQSSRSARNALTAALALVCLAASQAEEASPPFLKSLPRVVLKIESDGLRLTGQVPSMAHRTALAAALAGLERQVLLNHLAIDRERSERQLTLLQTLLPQAASSLHSGILRMEGDRLTLNGSTTSKELKERLLSQFAPAALPSLEEVAASITVSPSPAEPWIEAAFSAPALVRVGGATSRADLRREMEMAFISKFLPPDSFALRVSGEISDPHWQPGPGPVVARLTEDLSSLLSEGSLRLSPGRAVLRGKVPDLGSRLAATRLVRSALGDDVRIQNFLAIQTAPPETPVIAATPPSSPPSGIPSSPRLPLQAMSALAPAVSAEQPESPQPPAPAVPASEPPSASDAIRHHLPFKPGSTWINPVNRKTIQALIRTLQESSNSARLLIRSYPGREGDADINRVLSEKRSAGVKQLLVQGGVPANRIRIENRQLNAVAQPEERDRSVEIVLLP